MVINYRNIQDMFRLISSKLDRLPNDIDLVIGCPRSGMFPALIISALKNIPVASVDSFSNGFIYSSGSRLKKKLEPKDIYKFRKIMVIDDSILTGSTLSKTKKRLVNGPSGFKSKFIFAAVYADRNPSSEVDFYFEVCPSPRVFSWNLMHHFLLSQACMDIDGVICRDPRKEENDGDVKYLHFIENVHPKIIPSYEVGAFVTSRLEKYRKPTEVWLGKYNYKYRELFMMNKSSMWERIAYGHARFKAEIYKKLSWAILFIESSSLQAKEIAERSGKVVICTEDYNIYYPSFRKSIFFLVWRSPSIVKKIGNKLHQFLIRVIS